MNDDIRLSHFTDAQLQLAKVNDFIRIKMMQATMGCDERLACQFFGERYHYTPYRDLVLKAASAPLTTTDVSRGAELASPQPLRAAFVAYVLLATVVGRLLGLGARRVPPNVAVPAQRSGGNYRFTGQTAPKPVGNLQLASITLLHEKAAGIIVISGELAKLSDNVALDMVRNDMRTGMATYLDEMLTDPTNTGIVNEKPASILATAPSFGSAGSSSANVETDLNKGIRDFFAANPRASAPVWLMSVATAAAAIIATGEKNLNVVTGGTLLGIPAIVSAGVGNRLVIMDAAQLLFAGDDDVRIDVSTQADIEYETAPTSPPTASTIRISLWQSNCVGLRAEQFLTWKLANPSAALWTTVNYT